MPIEAADVLLKTRIRLPLGKVEIPQHLTQGRITVPRRVRCFLRGGGHGVYRDETASRGAFSMAL